MDEDYGSGVSDEGVKVFGGVDYLRAEACRKWHERRRGVPEGRVQRGDVLCVAQKVCGADSVGDATVTPTRGRERQAEAVGH